jgi:predicted O-methyltransferase YrrM
MGSALNTAKMRGLARSIIQYAKHRWQCANTKGHGVHSPFFFEFITRVLPDSGHAPINESAERYRTELLTDNTSFERIDLGIGSRNPLPATTVQGVAGRSLKSPRWCRLLFRMLRYYELGPVLELGTSFGVTTQYLAAAVPLQKIYTIEGDPFIAQRAMAQFTSAGHNNIETVIGDFNEVLPGVLRKMGTVGFVWLDGNHQRDATIRYVEQIIPYVQNETFLVLDDIYWSAGMQAAWETLKQHPQVCASIDLFGAGVLLFRKEFKELLHLRLHY